MSDASARARKLLAERADARKEIPIAPSRPSSAEHVVEEFFGLLADVVEENARLRAALVEARRCDHAINEYDEGGDVECTCGVDAHNARIDAALRGEEGTSVNESRIHAPIVFVKVCASCGHVAHDPDCPEAVEILDVTLRHTSERP